jgi:flagellar hook-length control protein FliK
MTTVSTTQSTDLLLSMLMGMVGSATPANSAIAPNNAEGGMMFAELLESPEGLSLGQPELGLTTADSGSEEDMYLGDNSAAGQFNALMAASLGTAPNLSLKPTTSATSESLETLQLSGAKSKSVAASNPDANSLFVSGNGGLGYSFAVDSEPFSSRSAAEATGEAVDALNPNQPSIAPEQELTEIPGATAPRTPAAAEKLESNSQIALNSNTGIGTKSNNEGELNRSGVPIEESAAPLNQVETKPLDAAQQAQSNQVTPAGGENSDKKEILSNRGPRNRSSKSNDSDSDNPVFSSIASGGFGSTGDSPIVTAVSGGMQSRQDGILGRGDAREEFASQISSRDSKGAAPESTNPEALPQLDLNAARSDFEQSLDRVAENFPLDSVAQQIVEVAEPDSGWISVEIQPPDLGKLEIMVSKQGDDYTARIIAHESSTEEALSLQQAELLEALNQHGLELKEVQIVSDSDSGSRWNLDSSSQQHSDSQERSEYYRERREDSQLAYPAADKPHSSSNATIQTAATQQVNFLV